jgi:predicted transcriptional regulator of viral defense system
MRAAGIPAMLNKHGVRVFTTGDFATLAGASPATASQILRRLAVSGVVGRIKRSLWANRMAEGLHPYEIAARLPSPWPAYVSLYSVLSDEGIIAEVPRAVYAVTPAIPRRYATAFGDFHLHHLPERLIWGYGVRRTGSASYPAADPEKAFCDLAYLALTIRSPLGFPRRRGRAWSLERRRVLACATRFQYPALLAWVRKEPFAH